MNASHVGNWEIARLLADAGADVSLMNAVMLVLPMSYNFSDGRMVKPHL